MRATSIHEVSPMMSEIEIKVGGHEGGDDEQ
jgi:hypothetical protein